MEINSTLRRRTVRAGSIASIVSTVALSVTSALPMARTAEAATPAPPLAQALDRYLRTTGLNTAGDPEQFWISDGQVMHSYAQSGTWSADSGLSGPPGGIRGDEVGYDLNYVNNPELYVVGADGDVWHDYATPRVGSGWSGWGSMGHPGTGIAGQVVVGRNYIDNQEIYVLGVDHQVWHKFSTPGVGTGWSEWGPMGAPAPGVAPGGDIHVSRNNVNNQELFVAAADGAVWHSFSTPGQGSGWSAWSPLGSPPGVTGDVAVWRNWANNQELFRVAGNAVWHNYATPGQGSGWSGWSQFPLSAPPGGLTGFIGLTDARSIGQLILTVKTTDGTYWNSLLAPTNEWTKWSSTPPARPQPPQQAPVVVPGVIHAPYIGDRNVVEGVASAGVMNVSQFNAGVVHMPGTAALCAAGNAVLGAHRTTSPRPFYSLNLLVPGTTMTASQNGVSCTYQVVEVHVDYVVTASAAAAAVQDVMSQSARFGSDHRLTLFACSQPNGQPTSTSYRLVVQLVHI